MVKNVKGVAEKEEVLDEERGQEVRLYELGYHILPIIAEEAIGEEVSKIKDVVEAEGSVIVSHEMPRSVTLAYPIPKVIQNKRTYYTSAYFGWMKFQAPSQGVPALQRELEKNPAILRFIIFKTTEVKAMRSPKKMKFFGAPKLSSRKEEASKGEEKALSEAELEKTVEELIEG